MKIVCDVIVAVLAVFGGYCALKLLSERVLSFRSFMPSAAVRLDGSEDDEYIDALLSEALAAPEQEAEELSKGDLDKLLEG